MNGSVQHKLVLFTDCFPFLGGETFLESEIGYLSEAFEEVLIITGGSGEKRPVPSNCRVMQTDDSVSRLEKIRSLSGIFHSIVREEIRIIRSVYKQKITKGMLFTMLISLRRAQKIEKICRDFLPKDSAQKVYFYSYWTDDKALGIALLQQKNPAIAAFSRIHRWDVYFEASGIDYLPFRHFIARNLKRIFAISEQAKSYCEKVWKIPDPAKISVSRLGVARQERTEHSSAVFTIVSCSNLIDVKRVHLIIEALATVENQKIHWIHLGDGVLYKKLTEIAGEKLKDNISFDFKGRFSNPEVLEFYRKNHVDLFINVSSSEGVPVSIMEVMSFGIPVIATDVGGTSEIVNNENGYLLPSDPTPELIAETITRFAALPGLNKEKLHAKAFQTWQEFYNAATNFPEFIQEIKTL